MLRRFLNTQTFLVLGSVIGPLFMMMYFVSDGNVFMYLFFGTGIAITIALVVVAVGMTTGAKSAAKLAALEPTGALALARVVSIQETGTEINDQPLVKLDLRIAGQGIQPFSSQDRVIASIQRLAMINSRKLVALVDPATNEYQIDWDRTAFVTGAVPAKFTIDEDNQSYDISGQVEPLMEILQILKANGIDWKNMSALRSNPAAREQVRAIVRRAAGSVAAAPSEVTSAPSTAQRLQALESLRVTGGISEEEYATKRGQIIADL
jgi:hypothetical protein